MYHCIWKLTSSTVSQSPPPVVPPPPPPSSSPHAAATSVSANSPAATAHVLPLMCAPFPRRASPPMLRHSGSCPSCRKPLERASPARDREPLEDDGRQVERQAEQAGSAHVRPCLGVV